MSTDLELSPVKTLSKRAQDLVSTSVEDMTSSLYFYTNDEDRFVLELALRIVNRRGEKTKAAMLRSKLKKIRQEITG